MGRFPGIEWVIEELKRKLTYKKPKRSKKRG
jgi:hypothetical protein